jgi:hypothetical protein
MVPRITCKWAPQMASYILCDHEALATLKLRQLGQIFMKLDDYEDISVSRILHTVQSMVLLNTWIEELHKRSIKDKVHESPQCPPFLYCTVFYSGLCTPKSRKPLVKDQRNEVAKWQGCLYHSTSPCLFVKWRPTQRKCKCGVTLSCRNSRTLFLQKQQEVHKPIIVYSRGWKVCSTFCFGITQKKH